MQITELSEDIMGMSSSGNKMYWMITSEMGAENFELRYVEMPPGGKSSYGSHPHEHEVFIVRGKGIIKGEYGEKSLLPNMAVFVPGDEIHQWINAGDEPFGFICVVPKGAEAQFKPKK
jgi:quercetin dioxygenase-like cupin family protein